jgi:hypothetical protein
VGQLIAATVLSELQKRRSALERTPPYDKMTNGWLRWALESYYDIPCGQKMMNTEAMSLYNKQFEGTLSLSLSLSLSFSFFSVPLAKSISYTYTRSVARERRRLHQPLDAIQPLSPGACLRNRSRRRIETLQDSRRRSRQSTSEGRIGRQPHRADNGSR